MQTASDLHHVVSNTIFGQAEHVLDNPTAFDASNGVFNHNPDAGQNVIEHLIADAQLLAFGLFFTWLVSTCAGS